MLHCAILRSPHAHARLKAIDVSEAEKLAGVAAVLTGEDARRWSQPTPTVPPGWGTHCLATEQVRFVGEPVATVAATMLARSDLLPPDVDPNPEATYVWTAPGRMPADEQGRAKSYLTAANACHLVLVEVDVETAQVQILKYFITDDCGTRLNPANVEGTTQGGVAQGVGAALIEEYVYDDDGQLLTSTFMDYLLPSIYEVPMTEKKALVTPSPFTPLGARPDPPPTSAPRATADLNSAGKSNRTVLAVFLRLSCVASECVSAAVQALRAPPTRYRCRDRCSPKTRESLATAAGVSPRTAQAPPLPP